MSSNDETVRTPASSEVGERALRAARPPGEHGLARQLALNAVLAGVVGEWRPPPRAGRYVLEEQLARGGMGVVFRGRDEVSGEAVAIKLLDRAGGDLRERFAREVETLRALAHPSIVRYLDHGVTDDGSAYLVMEWLEGQDLARRIELGVVAMGEALRLTIAAARGLAAAHGAGVVHRDVKPSNLFVVGHGEDDVRVIDFGIARAAGIERLTATGAVIGTPGYMAPEQIRGEHEVRSDVYGLGATLFELLTGRLPFQGDNAAALLFAVVAEPAPSLRGFRQDASEALDALVSRMLAKNPRDRPASMVDVEAELGALVGGLHAGPVSLLGLSLRERDAPLRGAPEVHEPPHGGMVGRAREIGVVRGIWQESLEDRRTNLALVVGDVGLGKSHFVDAFAEEVRRQTPAVRRLCARGRSDTRGRAFGLLASLVEVTPASRDCAARGRFEALLTELERGRHAGAGDLRSAAMLGDLLRLAWLDLVASWTDEGPVLLCVDDAHLCDLVSLRFIGMTMEFSPAAPLLGVFSTRPRRPLEELESLTGHLTPTRIALRPLGDRALARLFDAWAPSDLAEHREEIVRHAGGSPLQVRELIRARREGQVDASGTAAELVWARLERLDAESRRLLRAASIVGESATEAELTAVQGGTLDGLRQRECLDKLVREGLLVVDAPRASTALDEAAPPSAWRFDRELTRLAAYQLNVQADRIAGHHALAAWLAGRPQAPAVVIAEHWKKALQPARAAPYYAIAARAALAGGDAPLVASLVAEGLECAVDASLRAELGALAAEGSYWQGDLLRAVEQALAAARTLALPGSVLWLELVGIGMTAAGQLGDNAQVAALLEEVLATGMPAQPGAAESRAIVLARGGTQLVVHDPSRAAQALAEVASSVRTAKVSPLVRAWAHRASGASMTQQFDGKIEAFTRAHEAYLEGSDVRGAVMMQLYLGSLLVWTGAWARADEVSADAARVARRLGGTYLEVWALYLRGKLLSEVGSLTEARETLEAVVERAAQSPRIRAGAAIYLSLAALRAGDADLAVRMSRRVYGDPAAGSTRAPAAAALARALMASGQRAELAALAGELERVREQSLSEFEELVRLADVELCLAAGDEAALEAARRRARGLLDERARSLASPLRRGEYLHGPHLNAILREHLERPMAAAEP